SYLSNASQRPALPTNRCAPLLRVETAATAGALGESLGAQLAVLRDRFEATGELVVECAGFRQAFLLVDAEAVVAHAGLGESCQFMGEFLGGGTRLAVGYHAVDEAHG